jgi:phage protein D
VKLKPLGADFSGLDAFDVPSKTPQSEVVLDLASIKLTPGDYAVALHGGLVSKYSYNPGAVKQVEEEQKEVEKKAALAATELQKTTAAAKEAPPEKAAEIQAQAKAAGEKMKAMEAAKADVLKRMKSATEVAAPKEIVDIVVSEPIRVRVRAADAN